METEAKPPLPEMENEKKTWIEKHAGSIQTILAGIQTFVIVVMVFSLYQSRQSIKITQSQLEATIDPVVEISHRGGTNSVFLNSGRVAISDFRLVGFAMGFFNTNHVLDRGDYHAAGDSPVLKSKLVLGEELVFYRKYL